MCVEKTLIQFIFEWVKLQQWILFTEAIYFFLRKFLQFFSFFFGSDFSELLAQELAIQWLFYSIQSLKSFQCFDIFNVLLIFYDESLSIVYDTKKRAETTWSLILALKI